jgi:hypothetical protein
LIPAPAADHPSRLCRYRDKVTNALKGDGTVTYEDPFSAASAVQWFNGKEWKGAALGRPHRQ